MGGCTGETGEPGAAVRVRRLPARLDVAPGEAFASYVDRLAVCWQAPLTTLLHATGIASREHFRAVPSGYGVFLPWPLLEAFAYATWLEPWEVRSLLLVRYDQVALDFADAIREDRLVSGYGARIGWSFLASSHFCPGCLKESGGVWRLAWKLPWSFVCARHQLLLAASCPQCGQRAGAGRSASEGTPAFVARVPELGRCSKPSGLVAGAPRGRAAVPCGGELIEAPAGGCADGAVLATQVRLLEALESEGVELAGGRLSSLEFFSELRALAALILYAAEPDDLEQVPAGVMREAFVRHAEERARQLGSVAEGGRGRSGRWAGRYFTHVPTDPALMAAIAPLALDLLDALSADRADRALRWLAGRVRERGGGALPLPSAFVLSSRLRAALEAAGARRPSVRGGTSRNGPLAADDVPALLWPEVFEREFAALFPHVRVPKARLFCSLALVKWCEGCAWTEAAARLGLPAETSAKAAYGVAAALDRAGNARELAGRLQRLAQQLEAQPERLSYGRRRRRLADLADIDADEWASLCATAGLGPGGDARRRAAAAWLWAELTGGDVRLAPAWAGGWNGTTRMALRRFRLAALPRLREPLLALGWRLLHESPASGRASLAGASSDAAPV